MATAPKIDRPVAKLGELKQEVEEARTPPKEANPRHKREYGFDFRYTSPDGTSYDCWISNKILSIREKQAAAALLARSLGNAPQESVDPLLLQISRAVAHMTYSIQKGPKWADDLSELWDEGLVLALWEEVMGHEATFRRMGESPHGGDAAGGS